MELVSSRDGRDRRAYWLVLLAALACLAALIVPIAYLIAPALTAYAAARTKPIALLCPALAVAVCSLLLFEPVVATFLCVMTAGCGAALYFLQIKRFGNTNTALMLAGLFLIGLYGALCLPGALSGEGAFRLIQQEMDAFVEGYRAALQAAAGADTMMTDYFDPLLDTFLELVPNVIVPVLCIFSAVLGLGNLLFFRLLCKKRPSIVLDRMRPFRLWTIPRGLVLGLCALLVASLLLEWSEWTYATAFSNTVSTLLALPLSLQGLCVIDYVIERRAKNKTITRVLVYTALGVLYAFVQMPLTMIGCLEHLFRFRARLDGTPPRAAI